MGHARPPPASLGASEAGAHHPLTRSASCPQQECAAPASLTSRRPGPATARTRTSSLSTWTADSGSRLCPGPQPHPVPPAPAGPTQEALGLLSPCDKPQGTLADHSTPDSSTSGECRHATFPAPLLGAGGIPRAEQSFPRTPSLTALCSGDIRPEVPLLPASWTQGWKRGLSLSPHRRGDQALEREIACQDNIRVFGDHS